LELYRSLHIIITSVAPSSDIRIALRANERAEALLAKAHDNEPKNVTLSFQFKISNGKPKAITFCGSPHRKCYIGDTWRG